MDTSAALAIDELFDLSLKRGQHIFVSGLQGQAARVLDGLGVLAPIPAAQRFAHRLDAIVAALRAAPATS